MNNRFYCYILLNNGNVTVLAAAADYVRPGGTSSKIEKYECLFSLIDIKIDWMIERARCKERELSEKLLYGRVVSFTERGSMVT